MRVDRELFVAAASCRGARTRSHLQDKTLADCRLDRCTGLKPQVQFSCSGWSKGAQNLEGTTSICQSALSQQRGCRTELANWLQVHASKHVWSYQVVAQIGANAACLHENTQCRFSAQPEKTMKRHTRKRQQTVPRLVESQTG